MIVTWMNGLTDILKESQRGSKESDGYINTWTQLIAPVIAGDLTAVSCAVNTMSIMPAL